MKQMLLILNWDNLLSSLIYSGVGIVILILSFLLIELITPEKVWKEIIQNKNTALAIVTCAFILGLALIIASAIH
jgi:putative membrane protein